MIKLVFFGLLLNFLLTKIIIKLSKGIIHPTRDFVPKTENSKVKITPFGGICIFTSIILIASFYINLQSFLLLIPTLMMFALGLYDDLIKVISKSYNGVCAKMKFCIQVLASALLCFLVFLHNPNFNQFEIIIPFLGVYSFKMPLILAFLISFFAFVGTVNSVNLTDGLDGLAGKQILLIFLFIILLFYSPQFDTNDINSNNLITIIFIGFGAVLSFLIFNSNPASIFMGDSGSMGLGAIIASFFIILRAELILPALCSIFFIEALSVILQVWYFKKTKGKRLFKMSPLHHHFQLSGFKEQKIVEVTFFITFIILILFISPLYAW